MAWVRPKHPKRKAPVDPTESLRPVLEYFSCRPTPPSTNSKELARIPKKQLLLHDSYRPRPQRHQEEVPEHYHRPDRHPPSAPSEYHPRAEHHERIHHHHHHERADHHTFNQSSASYHDRASQRSTSHYTREPSPPPPPPLPSYRSNARPGAHLRLMPSRHRPAADTYIPRRPASSWASATTPLDM